LIEAVLEINKQIGGFILFMYAKIGIIGCKLDYRKENNDRENPE
jgi:hypothetical protein